MNTRIIMNDNRANSIVDHGSKISALWTTFMFLYIYVDYFALYMPDKIAHIQQGIVYKFSINQNFLLFALSSVSVPAIMISLTKLLRASISQWVNGIVVIIYIPYTLFNLAGEAWAHMIYGAAMEVIILALILYYSWKWPIEVKHE